MRISLSILGALLASALVSGTANAVEDGAKYGDWTANCEGEGNQQRCQIVQTKVNSENNAIGLKVVLFYEGNSDVLQMAIFAPLGVFLPNGLEIQIDDSEKARVPFVLCHRGGCETVLNVEGDTAAKFKAGSTMNVTYTIPPRGQKATIPVSLNGVTAGLQAIAPK